MFYNGLVDLQLLTVEFSDVEFYRRGGHRSMIKSELSGARVRFGKYNKTYAG